MVRVEQLHRIGRIALVAVAAALLVPMTTAGADEKADRDQVRQERAAVAAQLDALKASDTELLDAVQALDEQVRAQQAQVSDAQAAADAADAEAARIRGEIAATEGQVAGLEQQVRARAVASYVSPTSRFDTSEIVLKADDFGEAERQRVLAESVTGSDHDLVDQLRAAKAELTMQRQQADELSAEAAARRAEAEAKLADLEAAKADQERLRSALATRIADAQAESSGLAAEDARLTGIIQAREDEARRQAAAEAEAARRASLPSTTVPTAAGPGTTVAPTNGTTPSGPTPPTTVTRPPTSGGLIWPVAGSVSSEFGPRWGAMHSGIDIWAPIGTTVVAAKGGTVISTGFSGGYGNLVLIDHGGGFVTAYAHLSAIAVSSGQSIGQGQQVGAVGCTGSCTGPHLHFETRVNGVAQNPRNFLP